MKVSREITEALLSHSREGYPDEVCGLLAGKEGEVERIFRMTNVDKSSISYQMDPAEQFKVFKELRKEGLELMAIYHSHPTSPALPSQTDVKLAFYPEAVYIIVSLQKTGNPEIKGFRITDGKISEETIEITL